MSYEDTREVAEKVCEALTQFVQQVKEEVVCENHPAVSTLHLLQIKGLSTLHSKVYRLEKELKGLPIHAPDALQGSLRSLLLLLEQICTGKLLPVPYPPLSDVDKPFSIQAPTVVRLYHECLVHGFCSDTLTCVRISKNLRVFARSNVRANHYLSTLDAICADIAEANEKDAAETYQPDTRPTPRDYPEFVNKNLYDTVYTFWKCTCLKPFSLLPERHWGGLRLKEDCKIEGGNVAFQLLLSTKTAKSSPGEIEWKHVRLCIPGKASRSTKLNTCDMRCEDDLEAGANLTNVKRSGLPLELLDICKILGNDIGRVRISFKFEQEIMRMRPYEPIDQWVLSEPSVSLYQLLETHRLSYRAKVILAYILARSVWQFYNSDWMTMRWTVESIHFMKEESFGDGTQSQYSGSNVFAPYYALHVPGEDEQLAAEYIQNQPLLHHYPRILALGMLLVDICKGAHSHDHASGADNIAKVLNNEYSWYNCMIKKEEKWLNLESKHVACRGTYKQVVENCFNREIFKYAPHIEQRRAIIFEKVVHPLEQLLIAAQWLDPAGKALGASSPDTASAPHAAALNLPHFLKRGTEEISEESRAWLEQIQLSTFSKNLLQWFSSMAIRKTVPRIKVAVLDTGYDRASSFFADEVISKRLAKWKDFSSSQSTKPVDSDGHGTQVVSLLMKVAPAADVYVARIAENRPLIEREGRQISINVAKAIDWAVQEGADIISMSFGWSEEVADPDGAMAVSDALLRAVQTRKRRILLFAAASNFGANQPELFPGSSPLVTSIRATDELGAFKKFNAPSTDTSVFGTLGLRVPCAAYSKMGQDEVGFTGTSAATPIAAGIAALMLGRARFRLRTESRGPLAPTLDKLWEKSGMEKMFHALSEKTDYMYLSMNAVLQDREGGAGTDRLMDTACR